MSHHDAPPAPSSNPITIRGRVIQEDANGLWSLTDIWHLARSPAKRAPRDYRSSERGKKFTHAILKRNARKFGVKGRIDENSVIYAKHGRGGGTFADLRIAIDYAAYLNPSLAAEITEVWIRYKNGDPTLADEILQRAGPEANEWAGKRAMGRAVRLHFTDVLKAHGVEKSGYGQCTNAQYNVLFDSSAEDMKAARGVAKSGSLRDALDTKDLVTIAFAEQLASSRIEEEECRGNRECRDASAKSAQFVREAIERDKADRQRRHAG